MKPPRALADRIEAALRDRTNPERRAHAEGYSPTSMEVIGVAVPDIRRAVKPVSQELQNEPPDAVLAVAEDLLARGLHEGRQAAYELIGARADVVSSLGARRLRGLGAGNDNWASVDAFATGVVAPAWRSGAITDRTIGTWARSSDRWWRRTALVATVPLNVPARGGTGDAERTLKVCEQLAGDSDAMVAKALSWALRSLIRHDPEAVEAFLERRAGDMAGPVVREVRNKLETGRKNRSREGRDRGGGLEAQNERRRHER